MFEWLVLWGSSLSWGFWESRTVYVYIDNPSGYE